MMKVRKMKDRSYIMEGIDLLIANAKPYKKPSVMIKVLDIVFTTIFLSAYAYMIFFLVSSLINFLR
tara:strand:- start:1013 stop:1210 length:198 start_codon:yes stop_codon:yes gene_type:complete